GAFLRDQIGPAGTAHHRLALFLGRLGELREAAGGAARPDRRAAFGAGTPDIFEGLGAVHPALDAGIIGIGAQFLGNAIAIPIGQARADEDLAGIAHRAGIIAIDDDLLDL